MSDTDNVLDDDALGTSNGDTAGETQAPAPAEPKAKKAKKAKEPKEPAEPKAKEPKQPAEPKAKKVKEPKEPKRGIGTVIMERLRAGDTNEQALAAARAEFPNCATTTASVNWYRSKLLKDPKSGVLSARELSKRLKAAEKAKTGGPDAEDQGTEDQGTEGDVSVDALEE